MKLSRITKVNPQGAEQMTPIYKIANANHNFFHIRSPFSFILHPITGNID
jgi:hypothetical protein